MSRLITLLLSTTKQREENPSSVSSSDTECDNHTEFVNTHNDSDNDDDGGTSNRSPSGKPSPTSGGCGGAAKENKDDCDHNYSAERRHPSWTYAGVRRDLSLTSDSSDVSGTTRLNTAGGLGIGGGG